MTVNEAIAAADEMRPNTFDDDRKTRWLSRLEGKLAIEVHQTEDEVPVYEYSRDGNKELLVSEPHCEIYPLFLVAMIDFYNQDIEAYENAMALFNSEFDIYAKWYIRTHMPKSKSGFRNLF